MQVKDTDVHIWSSVCAVAAWALLCTDVGAANWLLVVSAFALVTFQMYLRSLSRASEAARRRREPLPRTFREPSRSFPVGRRVQGGVD